MPHTATIIYSSVLMDPIQRETTLRMIRELAERTRTKAVRSPAARWWTSKAELDLSLYSSRERRSNGHVHERSTTKPFSKRSQRSSTIEKLSSSWPRGIPEIVCFAIEDAV
jgi:hypothetical protein